MIEVKRATIEDVGFLYRELKLFAQVYGTKRSLFPAEEDDALKVIARIVNEHVCFVSWDGEERTGFIAGWFARHPFNPDILLLNEAFWWVSDFYRSTRAGSALLDKYIEWGRLNAHWITMALETDSPISSRSLTKRGFKPKEISFIMECENGSSD